jgi:hypothetical protein
MTPPHRVEFHAQLFRGRRGGRACSSSPRGRRKAVRPELSGELTVTTQDGKLAFSLGKKLAGVPLQHWDRDLFDFRPPDDTGLTEVVFTVGGDGRASRGLLEALDRLGQGTFVRVAGK